MRCQFNIFWERKVADEIENAGAELGLRYTEAGRKFLEERLELHRFGRKLRDERLPVILGAIAALQPGDLEKVVDLLRPL